MNDEQLITFLKDTYSGSHPQKMVRAYFRDESSHILTIESKIAEAGNPGSYVFEKRELFNCELNIESLIRKVGNDNFNREAYQRVAADRDSLLGLIARFSDDALPFLIKQDLNGLSELLFRKQNGIA
jgi:hypothetical protein